MQCCIIAFFVPYKQAGTHFSIHPSKQKELEKLLLAFKIRGLFARLHRFYRKSYLQFTDCPFSTNCDPSSPHCPY